MDELEGLGGERRKGEGDESSRRRSYPSKLGFLFRVVVVVREYKSGACYHPGAILEMEMKFDGMDVEEEEGKMARPRTPPRILPPSLSFLAPKSMYTSNLPTTINQPSSFNAFFLPPLDPIPLPLSILGPDHLPPFHPFLLVSSLPRPSRLVLLRGMRRDPMRSMRSGGDILLLLSSLLVRGSQRECESRTQQVGSRRRKGRRSSSPLLPSFLCALFRPSFRSMELRS